ncbi:MAG: Calx-beta domain-containing protein, partial [Planctomycetota bacterium]
MRRTLMFLGLTVSLLGLPNSGSAIEWTGLGVGDSWCTPDNWAGNMVPGESNEAYLNPPPGRGPVIDCDVTVGDLYGPRWDSDSNQVLDINSGTIVINLEWRWGDGGSGTSIINIRGSSHITVNEEIRGTDSGKTEFNMSGGSLHTYDKMRVSDDANTLTTFNISGGSLSMDGEWKWGDKGDVVLNMSGGSIDVGTNWRMHCGNFSNTDVSITGGDIWVDGEVRAADSSLDDTQTATINLSAGTINADSLLLPAQDKGTGILNMRGGTFTCRNTLRVPNVEDGIRVGIINLDGGTVETASFYIDQGGELDVNDGILIIDGDVRDDIVAAIDAGYIYASDGRDVIASYDSGTTKTTVSTTSAVAFETASSADLETVSPAALAVTLYNPPDSSTVTVEYAVTGGTADGNSVDYNLPAGTLTFTPGGATTKTIDINVIEDGEDEEDETIEVTLSNPVNADLGANVQHVYTILNLKPRATFDTAQSEQGENISPAYVPVSLSWAWSETVTVDYNVTGGTAIAGDDYSLTCGTLVFEPCEVTENITITIIEDDFHEDPDETIEITLSNPNNARLGTITKHTFTILPPGPVRTCPEGDVDGTG